MPLPIDPRTSIEQDGLTLAEALRLALAADMTHIYCTIMHGRPLRDEANGQRAHAIRLDGYLESLRYLMGERPANWYYEYLDALQECTIWQELKGEPYIQFNAFILDKGR